VSICAADIKIFTPEQIHIAIGSSPSEMNLQWSTIHGGDIKTASSVEWGEDPNHMSNSVDGDSTIFVDGGEESYTQTHHLATMTGLSPSTKYYYQVGGPDSGFSDVLEFTSAPDTGSDLKAPLRFGIWGDMGTANSQILSSVQKEVASGNFDMILHVGDFAYNMDNDNGRNGDAFMNNIQR